ncbi:uncharacterized protein LOC128559254 [Mercenaria mercenaria]|uniref:uncharacterized protein LOC128559254 n=1 Tax=Mercenaria mercenaria TaxID=6596 RepID=UPI00234F93A8|nr:uncharacterized protein LOC128559254 [Mercenaria mercenaria]
MAVNMFGYIIPVLSLFVTTMNVLIIIVFVKRHMRSHTTFILTLIACVEILNIDCPAIVFAYLYLRGSYKHYLTSEQIKWSYLLGKICVDMFNMCSLWLTVLLAFIRYRCISSPFVARKVHSPRKIIIYVVVIIVFVGLVHVPSFYLFEFRSVTNVDPISNLTTIVGALIEREGVYLKSCSGRKLHIIVETLTDSLIPSALLVCCNIKLLITLRKAKQSRSSLRHTNNVCFKSDEENSQKNINTDAEPSKINSRGSTNQTLGLKKVFHFNERYIPNISQPLVQNNKCKTNSMKDIKERRDTQHNFYTFKSRHTHASTSSDHSLDKLDRESERTSLLILLVSTIILVHECPLAIVNTYTLANYSDKPLPLSKGCFSIVVLLWQFITYPAIFLIYSCMCKAFRKELWKILTCLCRREKRGQSNMRKPFPCPCSVRKRIPRDGQTSPRPLHENVQDRDNCSDKGNDLLT